MKFTVTFKDPDGPSECLDDEAKRLVDEMRINDADDHDALIALKRRKLSEFTSKWLDYGEYVTIEFDTDAGTATVMVNK